MKLVYVANIRIPTEKAHGKATMKMCEAFAKSGMDVELLVPRRMNSLKAEPFEFYGVHKDFKLKRIPVIDLVALGKFGFFIEWISFALGVFIYSLFLDKDYYYGRDELSLFFISLIKRKVVWEAHLAKNNWVVRGLISRLSKLVVISNGLKEHYETLGMPNEMIAVAHSGVDLDEFESVRENKADLRARLSLPTDKKIIAYIGKDRSMGEKKGVEEIIQDFEDIKSAYANAELLIVKDAPPRLVPAYMKAADILVMNYPDTEHYKKFMSPLKVFEYMASGNPIVASGLPSIREVLNDNNSVLVEPHDNSLFAKKIVRLLNDEELSASISKQALKDVEKYSWDRRAENILNFIK